MLGPMFLENMGLKEAISKRLKASKYNKVEYWPLIINKAKEKNMYFVLINNKKINKKYVPWWSGLVLALCIHI